MPGHDQTSGPGFKLLPCRVSKGIHAMSQLLHFPFGDTHLFIAWHENTVVIMETSGTELSHLESNCVLHDPGMLDAPVENFIRIGDSIRCLDKSGGLYELKQLLQTPPTCSKYDEDKDMFSDSESTVVKQFRFVKNLKLNKVVRLAPLNEGLVLIKKQVKGNVYMMNFYTHRLVKKFSIHLPGFNPEDEKSCFLAPCTARLEPRLSQMLLKDDPGSNANILFAGWGGSVYALAVSLSLPSAPVPMLVYHSDHLVTTVLTLEGAAGSGCAVGIVLAVGCMVCLSLALEPVRGLRYTTLYLPTPTFRILSGVRGHVVCGDGQHLWLCDVAVQPSLHLGSVLLPVKAVAAIAVITGTDAFLAVTMYGDLYWLSSNCMGRDEENGPDSSILSCRSVESAADVLRAIHEGSSRVQELSEQIAVEDKLIAGLNVATRIDTLTRYFELQVTVDRMELSLLQPSTVWNLWSPNMKMLYQLNISVHNLTYQQFMAPAWSLAISARAGGETCTRLVRLEHGLSEHQPLQVQLPLAVPHVGAAPVEIACSLVSHALRPGGYWVLITVGSVTLDVSYFFELQQESFPSRLVMRRDGLVTMCHNLVDMACHNNLSLQVQLNHLRLFRNDELKCVMKFHRPVEARSLWCTLLRQCRHRMSAELQAQYQVAEGGGEAHKAPRNLVLYAGCQRVSVALDQSRTMATLSCCDTHVLHAVRKLLATCLLSQRSASMQIATELLHKADHILSTLDEMDILQIQKALQDWRKHSSQMLPF